MAIGTIFDVKHYAVHDGPGIRTTVFMKGCPLRCLWCHNPESFQTESQLLYDEQRCIQCGNCVEACENGVHEITEGRHLVHRDRCVSCFSCSTGCYSGALELAGRKVSTVDLLDEVLRDKVFYANSGGGVTVSGGEPLAQPSFTKELLSAIQSVGVHTTLDTSGYSPWSTLEEVSSSADLVLYDIKHMDSETHRALTGVPNELILENLIKLNEACKPFWIRIPMIPRLNDGMEHFRLIGEFLSELNCLERVDILRYHRLAESKYQQAGLNYRLLGLETPTKEDAEARKVMLLSCGVKNVFVS